MNKNFLILMPTLFDFSKKYNSKKFSMKNKNYFSIICILSMKTKKPNPELLRLNKYLAGQGVASRRKADELIEKGKVQINGRKIFEPGLKINPKTDKVKVNGKSLGTEIQPVYFIFNKPKNVVTSTSDPEGRPTVLDFFKKIRKRVFPVGRLDWGTEGLLLITNDGDFAWKVTNPKSKIPRTYHAKLDGQVPESKLEKLKKGVSIVGGRVRATHIKHLGKKSDKKDWIQITITEGKNRQVRKMFQKIGFDVVKLKRVAIGQLKLSGLKPGDYRPMNQKDLKKLFNNKPSPTGRV